MYEINIERIFSAAHAIRLYDGSLEPVHGHNWTVDVTVAANELDRIELVMDFHQLEETVDALIGKVKNRNFNDIDPFSDGQGGLAINPTAERVAWWIGREMMGVLPERVKLVYVKVGEAPGCTATFRP